jgi:hypothetical protein
MQTFHGERKREVAFSRHLFEREKIIQVYALQSSERKLKAYPSKRPLQDK